MFITLSIKRIVFEVSNVSDVLCVEKLFVHFKGNKFNTAPRSSWYRARKTGFRIMSNRDTPLIWAKRKTAQLWIRPLLVQSQFLITRNTHIKEGFFLYVFWGSHGRSTRNDRLHLGQFNNPLALFILPRVVVSQLIKVKKSDKKDSEYELAFLPFPDFILFYQSSIIFTFLTCCTHLVFGLVQHKPAWLPRFQQSSFLK